MKKVDLVWISIAGMVIAAFLPWVHTTVGLFPGDDSGVAFDVKGVDIGSDVGVDYGWIMIAIAVVAFVAVGRGVSRLLVGAGVAAVLVAGYAALTAASHTTSAIARDIYGNVVTSDLLDPRPHVTTAYGVIFELVAAILLLVSAIRLSGAPSLGEVPDDAGRESPALGSEQVGDARPD
jgi:hypothetical protein